MGVGRRGKQTTLASLFRSIGEALIISDTEGKVTFLNHAAERLTGWKREEAEGRPLSEVVHTVTESSSISSSSSVFRERTVLIAKNDKRIPVDFSTSVLKEDSGEVSGFISFIRDVSKHQAAEKELAQSRARYKDLVNSIKEVVWEADAQSVQLTFVSKQIERLSGYPPEAWIREKGFWIDHVHPDDRDKALKYFADALQGSEKDNGLECRMIRADGTFIWVRILVTATLEEGHGKLCGLILNISEEKEVEFERRRLEKAVETMQLGVTITDLQRRILYTNAAEAAMHGYTPEELIGKDISIFIPSVNRAPMTADQIKELTRHKRESINRRRDGSLFPVRLISDLIKDAEGNPVSVVTTCEDITEQKQLQEALRHSYEDLENRVRERTEDLRNLADQRKRVLELSQSLLATLSVDRVVKRMILTLREALSFDICGIYWLDEKKGVLRPAIVVGEKRFSDWEIPMDRGIVGSVIRARLGELVNNAHRDPRSIYPPGLHPRCDHFICIPLQTKGKIHGVFTVSRRDDPHFSQDEFELVYLLASHAAVAIENARLFEQIQSSETKYRSLFEESQDVVFMGAAGGGFLDINPAGVRLFGYGSRKEMLAPNVQRELFSSDEDWTRYRSALDREGFVRNFALTLRKKSGEKLTVLETTSAVRNEQNEITGFRGIIRDITELQQVQEAEKKLQEKLRNAETLEKMGRLVSGVAHEVRNPLTSILAVTELLERDFSGNLQYRPLIGGIRTQVTRLASLMRDLLELGKPVDQSRMARNSLTALCTTTADLWKQTDPKRTHQLLFDSTGAEDLPVWMDSAKIQQVLINLLDNASQHSPPGSVIRMVLTQSNGAAGICIQDEGAGIPGQNFTRLFTPFFTTRKGGVGLGLSLVKHFVEMHGGKISAWNNKPRPGSTFEVTLPLSP
jgi:PAS domain S-box-containing protein